MTASQPPTHPLSAADEDAQGEVSSRRLFITLALVLVVSMVLAATMGNEVLRINRQHSDLYDTRGHLDNFFKLLCDAETGQRGYLLVGGPKYLEPFTAAEGRLATERAALIAEADAGRIERHELDALFAAADRKMDELRQTIRLYDTQGPAAAMEVVRTDTGRRVMDEVRLHTQTIMRTIAERRAELQRRRDSFSHARTVLFVAVTLVNVLCLYRAFRLLKKQAARRRRAAADLARQTHLLDTTLRSIGDGVIVADTDCRVTFINPVAAKLCGWDAAEATGRRCEEVFRIVSEETRQVVENPVEKVVRTGTTGSLADHTLLVRRDGTEIPIDDSGAPIRDEHGVLHGVVLIFRDFTEHKKTEAALQQARAAAEAASRAKDNFLATLSHELRTPLTPVMMTLSAWEADDTLKAGTADEVRMMRRNLDLEARLIDDLLDLTRIIRGKMHIKLERADVNALVAAAEQMYENDFRSKRVSVDVRLDARESFALIDPARFQQVLWNVLKNAMKFTPAGGKIRVLTEQNDGRLRVTVTDTGIGMSPELLARLFRPFEQSDELRVRRQGGLGLGLAIAKALIERQNGTITAHSAGVEKGSTFVIEVPSAGGAPADTGAPAQTPDRPAAGTRLLLVEDHADTALALSRLLRKNDYEVLIAGSVAEAADVSDRETVDLLLSDVGLPDGTGVDVVKRFREKSAAPAIALTGYGMEDDVQMCLKAGFTLHMTKPVNFTKLLETIRTLISLRA